MADNFTRTIAHLDLDSFFVSVERLRNPDLLGKPLIIGGSSNRGVVASCSYETRKFGVRSAMPMYTAKKLCPEAIIISGDMESYSYYSKTITDIMRANAPVFEKASIDEFYIDLSGMDRFFGCFQWVKGLRQTIIRETGLPISLGLSVNKMVAKVATGEAKPNGELQVLAGSERDFLAPMSISKIPMLGKKTYEILHALGIDTVSALRELPIHRLENLLGKNGVELWNRANAIDNSPVIPFSERKSISTENTFRQDSNDKKMLHATLVSMVEEIAFKLRSEGKLTACVAVKIRYSNFDTVSKQLQIPYTSSDHVLNRIVTDLFNRLFDNERLVRLVGVRFSNLVKGNYQIHLFDDTESNVNLYQAIDKIKGKHGSNKIMRAVGMYTGRVRVEKPEESLTRLRYNKK